MNLSSWAIPLAYMRKNRKEEKTDKKTQPQYTIWKVSYSGLQRELGGHLNKHYVLLFPLPAETSCLQAHMASASRCMNPLVLITLDAVWSVQTILRWGVCKLFLRNHSRVQICNLTERGAAARQVWDMQCHDQGHPFLCSLTNTQTNFILANRGTGDL